MAGAHPTPNLSSHHPFHSKGPPMSDLWSKLRRSIWNNRAASPAPEPAAKPLSEAALKAALHRECQPFTVGGFRPTNHPTASVFGGIRVAKPGTDWPTCDGQPMLPLCQLNLSEPTLVPNALHDLALLQIFVANGPLDTHTLILNSATPTPDAPVLIRAFDTLDGLTLIDTPAMDPALKPFEIAFDAPTSDYANNDVAPPEVDRRVNDVYAYDWAEGVYTSKLGGWPATIQSEPWWDYKQTPHRFDYVLQIGPEPKSYWAADALFLARASDDPTKWAMDHQMY